MTGAPSVDRVCEACCKPFKTYPYKVAQGKGRFCSPKCHYGPRVASTCGTCGKAMLLKRYLAAPGKPRYCSRACATPNPENRRFVLLTSGDVGFIPARDGDVITWVLVSSDATDMALRTWAINGGYVTRPVHRGPHGRMHRDVMGLVAGDGKIVDHINGDPLDNRRCNLRIVTSAQNSQNLRGPRKSASGLRGVSKSDNPNRWKAYCGSDYLGSFRSPEEAAARAAAERAARGWLTGAEVNR